MTQVFRFLFFVAAVYFVQHPEANAQEATSPTSSELYHRLLKSNTVGTVLYMAAHPDDENTRLISYLENEQHLRVGYLSLTRGDGGQNLIGTEIGSGIGMLRTQELLAARKIDGAEQFFTRAVDFGYSKSAEETLALWDQEEILSDVVWVIRNFKPDVIITRFPPNSYAGHGHHTSSAILAEEAFEAAADPKRFPEQLQYVKVWQPKRLYFNVSSWWQKDIAEKASKDDNIIQLNPGQFDPLLGESYAEIAAESRSQHKSQGFGSEKPKGDQMEYLEYVKGDKTSQTEGLFKDIDKGWSRLGNSDQTSDALQKAIEEFNFKNPALIVPHLIKAIKGLSNIEDEHWRNYKREELTSLLLQSSGIWLEALAPDQYVTPGEDVLVDLRVINRGPVSAVLNAVTINEDQHIFNETLDCNNLLSLSQNITVTGNYSTPYWLKQPYNTMFKVDDQQLIGKAENDPALVAEFELTIDGFEFTRKIPVRHKRIDPVKAEINNPVYIVPALTVNFTEKVVLFPNGDARAINLKLRNNISKANGTLKLDLPEGWRSQPEKHEIRFSKENTTQEYTFQVIPSQKVAEGKIKAVVTYTDSSYSTSMDIINYDHIPSQIILSPAEVAVKNFELQKTINRIAYIQGPGDDVAAYMGSVGFLVDILSPEDLGRVDLSQYPAILTGIRAFNAIDELKNYNDILSSYVKNGGTWVVQYNTNRRLILDQIGPYPFSISYDRVTEEDAEVKILNPDHPVFNYPNKITETDFAGWVQERGLYFANEWSSEFTPLLSWHDKNDPETEGGLLVAKYGQGHFVYTGISFFRQLPAGATGSYRLLTNILSLGTYEEN